MRTEREGPRRTLKHSRNKRLRLAFRVTPRPGGWDMGRFGGFLRMVHRHDQGACGGAGGVTHRQQPVIGPDKIRQYPQSQEIFDKDNADEDGLLPACAR